MTIESTKNIDLLPQNNTGEVKKNILTFLKEKTFNILYKNQTSDNKILKDDDGEIILEFYKKHENNTNILCSEKIGNMIFNRVLGEKNGSFYIYSLDNYKIIQKFYITENGEKELVKSMFGCIIEYKGEKYTRIITKESGEFYINIKTHKKLYEDSKLVNFLKKKKNGEFQIDTY